MAVSSTGSTSSVFNSYGIKTNNGIGGLMSGLDTDSLVEALTAGTRAKIAKQGQQKQLLSWKQTAYRDVANTLRTFQNKFISTSSATSIRRNDYFQTYKGSSSSSKVELVSGSTSATGSVDISQITSLASAQTMTVNQKLSQKLEGTKDFQYNNQNFAGQSIKVTVEGTQYNIKLDSLSQRDFAAEGAAASGGPISGDEAFQKALQELVTNAVGTRSVEAGETQSDGTAYPAGTRLPIVEVSVLASNDGTNDLAKVQLSSKRSTIVVTSENQTLGLESNMSNRISSGSVKLKDLVGMDNLQSEDGIIKFKINDREITADVNKDSLSTLLNKITNSAANVKATFNTYTEQIVFTSTKTGAGNNIDFEDTQGNFMHLLVGARGQGKLTSNVSDSMSIGFDSTIEPASMSKDSLQTILEGMANSVPKENPVFTIKVGDELHHLEWGDVSLPSNWDDTSAAEYLQDRVNTIIKGQMNRDDISFEATTADDGTVSFKFKGPDNVKVELVATDTDPNTNPKLRDPNPVDLFAKLGFTGATNANPGGESKLSDLFTTDPGSVAFTMKKNDGSTETFTFSTNTSLSDFIDGVNAKMGADFMSFQNGQVSFDAGANALVFEDSSGGLMNALFGISSYDSSAADVTDSASGSNALVTVAQGKNAEIELLDGTILSSSTNTFTVNGIAFEVNDFHMPTTPEKITITSKSDPEELIDKLKNFVEEYNTLVGTLNTLIYEKGDSSYQPLTEEQKADMTTEEIKSWETEAKKGLLRNDSTIRGIQSELRSVLTKTVEGAGIALYDLGITTLNLTKSGTTDMTKSGMIEISDETKLREMLEKNPEAVRVLFTEAIEEEKDADGNVITKQSYGIGKAMEDIITRATNTTVVAENRGSLVHLAGTEMNTGESYLGNRIDQIDQFVTRLKLQLQTEYSRYWSKFSSLETALSRLNSQSSWLSQNA